MPYYGQGDYYMAGDPGLFSSIGGLLKRTARVGLGFVTGGPGGAVRAAMPSSPGPAIPRFSGGGRSRSVPRSPGTRRRRRINYANDKALKRAIRRQEGFVKLARKALKGSGYKIVSKSAGRGSRGTITRAEAERALRN